MTRDDAIRKRLEGYEARWPEAITAFDANAPSDLRYLLERVERLEGLLFDACLSLDVVGDDSELGDWYRDYRDRPKKEPADAD